MGYTCCRPSVSGSCDGPGSRPLLPGGGRCPFHWCKSQRRFTANAAHELRTPLAIQRTAIEVGLTDPDPRRVARTRADMLTVVRRSEHLIESLLLSTSDQGLEHNADVPLHDVVRQVLAEVKTDDPRLTAKIEPVTVRGDSILLAHLVGNLVRNAAAQNISGGYVNVHRWHGRLDEVSNSGTGVPPEAVSRLLEPFQRCQARSHQTGEGVGLGLAIVTSIAHAHAHAATMHVRANADGGLTVEVDSPPIDRHGR
ncbi:sensor histidine kinase [Streptomyces sp. G5(2025)]|uniref:sensor histidine kinase n=1 Tax=Streptomyces sp. G5(2025) TaxID=3406628 RepID=UPI003C178E13